jgi:uncharacterized protein (DUF2344 family)
MLTTLLLVAWLMPAGATATPALPPDGPAVVTAQETEQSSMQKLFGSLTKYHVVAFTEGPKWTKEKAEKQKEGVKKNAEALRKLVKDGKLVGLVAVKQEAKLKLLAFLKTESDKEAHAIVDNVAAVKNGILKADLYLVWGTRGMGEKLRQDIEKKEKVGKEEYFLTFMTKGKNWVANPDPDKKALAEKHAQTILQAKDGGFLRFYGVVEGSGDVRNLSIIAMKSEENLNAALETGFLVEKGWFAAPHIMKCAVFAGTLP